MNTILIIGIVVGAIIIGCLVAIVVQLRHQNETLSFLASDLLADRARERERAMAGR